MFCFLNYEVFVNFILQKLQYHIMVGRLEVITGCMFSGKTEELVDRVLDGPGQHELIVPEVASEESSLTDNNWDVEPMIVKTDNREAREIVDSLDDDIGVVGLDRVNLFANKANEICKLLLFDGYRVVVSGLDMDFRGAPFQPMDDLLCVADEVVKKKTDCQLCGKEANMTQRMINGRPARYNDSILMFGGSEEYFPVCRDCHTIKTEDD